MNWTKMNQEIEKIEEEEREKQRVEESNKILNELNIEVY